MNVSERRDERAESSPLRRIRVSATETSLLDSYGRVISGTKTRTEAVDAAAQCLRQLSAATVFAFFRYDRARDLLICESAPGDKEGLLLGLTIAMGTRVTGWSAATQRSSINANAALDLANVADFFDPPLRSVFSVPVIQEGHTLGVFTAYSHKSEAFSESQTYAFEQIATVLSNRLHPGSEVDPSRQIVFRPRNY
jgi:putative methionine-R-sulfoxide reductase with GAF domain